MRPLREQSRRQSSVYFISTQTVRRQPFFRHERWAVLLRETILHYRDIGYSLHAYVIMPDHVHMLIVPTESLEKAAQLIKGGFSFRAKRELGRMSEIWQPGFSDHRIRDEADWKHHLEYIRQNPVQARLVLEASLYPYVDFPKQELPQGLKPEAVREMQDVRAKARTLQAEASTVQPEARDPRSEDRTLHADAKTPHSDSNEVLP